MSCEFYLRSVANVGRDDFLYLPTVRKKVFGTGSCERKTGDLFGLRIESHGALPRDAYCCFTAPAILWGWFIRGSTLVTSCFFCSE